MLEPITHNKVLADNSFSSNLLSIYDERFKMIDRTLDTQNSTLDFISMLRRGMTILFSWIYIYKENLVRNCITDHKSDVSKITTTSNWVEVKGYV